MLLTTAVVYKVMKKVGKLTEARMVLPPEPKVYPMVSDRLFEGKVKLKKKLKEDEVPNPRDLASNRPPQASLSTTNSPRRATPASVQVGGPYDEEANEAKKDDKWIQDAEEDIERRGTKGKCTPITKKSCTGKAKALAKTFKKMAKKRASKTKNEANLQELTPAGEQAAAERAKQKDAEKRGDHAAAGAAEAARRHNARIRQLRPRRKNGGVPGKMYRDDAV